ncbi:MAG: ATP-binding cassette domain-containing protein, partial [Roseiflexaceae bacterium]
WMGWRMLSGQVTLGDVVLFYQAFNQGQSLIRSLLNDVGYIYKDGLFLSNLFEFLDLQPGIVGPAAPISVSTNHTYSVRFRQVTFQYPASQRPALQNFDITIPAGQLVAIVGANGAGKSTFSKLLCRFYDPDSGSIELDGIDIRNLAIADLRQLITVLFQMPVRYQATAGQNIALGDLSREHDLDATIAAARGAGADAVIERLPQGYDTPLGKWFADGTELSGGEWQRIALARAFLRQSPIVILDEPTSFMDSWAEAEWLDRFRSLVERRTALIITHRFTTAMRADIIHVMDQGQIVESGTHEQLLTHSGLYAQSWQAQMRASTGMIDLSSRSYAPLVAV